MFFYIKFVEGPHLGKKYLVPTEKIKYSFKSNEDFDKKKKYFAAHKDGVVYKCQILLRAG